MVKRRKKSPEWTSECRIGKKKRDWAPEHVVDFASTNWFDLTMQEPRDSLKLFFVDLFSQKGAQSTLLYCYYLLLSEDSLKLAVRFIFIVGPSLSIQKYTVSNKIYFRFVLVTSAAIRESNLGHPTRITIEILCQGFGKPLSIGIFSQQQLRVKLSFYSQLGGLTCDRRLTYRAIFSSIDDAVATSLSDCNSIGTSRISCPLTSCDSLVPAQQGWCGSVAGWVHSNSVDQMMTLTLIKSLRTS